MESLRQVTVAAGRDVLLHALESFSKDDFSARLPLYLDGIDAEVAVAFNAAAEANERFTAQVQHIEERMRQVERERAALEEKARQLALSSRRQWEFLANTSDDLRTPLSSLLTLAKLLADNDSDNLTAKQVDYAQTIYAAGTDLLSLVDEILDLARIESDQIVLNIEDEPFQDLHDYFLRAFRQTARDKRMAFDVVLAKGLPVAMRTDGKRLRKILRNLLSIAFRFAHGGSVTLHVAPGSAPGRQEIVFQVFHQADGSIGCEYGTGLGLSICRELAHSLGGEVHAVSAPGDSFRFVLRLPLFHDAAQDGDVPSATAVVPATIEGDALRSDPPAPSIAAPQLAYQRHTRRCSDEAVMLIAEGNAQVASVMLELVRGNGYQGVVATDLGTLRVLVREIAPEVILLGGSLMDIDGWTMLELLQRDPETRRISVGMSYFDSRGYLGLQLGGAIGFGDAMAERTLAALDAAAGRRVLTLLLADIPEFVCNDEAWRRGGRETTVVADAAQALEALRRDAFDALVVGSTLGDMSAIELVRAVSAEALRAADLPVAMIEMPGLSPAPGTHGTIEVAVLRRRSRLEDILDETALFLHRSIGNLPPAGRESALRRREAAPELANRKVLIVDDDIYNIYAMTGALEQQGMIVVLAESSKEGSAALRAHPDTDVVLIDITMPEAEGGGTIRAMRGMAGCASLPIIAVTARAMPGDREKCIGAGASDYIAKPVNIEQLLALLRTWLARRR